MLLKRLLLITALLLPGIAGATDLGPGDMAATLGELGVALK